MNAHKLPCLLLLASLSVHAQSKIIMVGIAAEPYLPFTTYDAKGEWFGYEIDIIKDVCQIAEFTCHLKPIAWDGLIPSLVTGKVDVIIGAISITPERQAQMTFTQPYLKENAAIVTHKSNKTPIILAPNSNLPTQMILQEQAFNGKTLGVQSGSTSYRYVQHYFPQTKTKYYEAADNAIADLRFARIDYLVGTEFHLKQFLQTPQGQDYEIKAILEDETLLGKGIGMAMMPVHSALLAEFNQALQQLENSHQIAKRQAQWFTAHP